MLFFFSFIQFELNLVQINNILNDNGRYIVRLCIRV